ncbi:hypothetical protein DFR51_0950 [Sphingosinicella microcystinivorans]|nr:hypothetical protein DFR51_0950 [Sphingosinicella microcystinivorans]
MGMQGLRHAITGSLLAVLVGGSAAGFAKAPGDVSDLVDARASSGESQLYARGYSLHHTSPGDDRNWGYWWNGSKKKCLSVVTMDGRYSAITEAPNSDCGHKADNNAAGVAAAVGAAAIIGAVALSHKSHNHDDGNHYSNSADEAEYERGYRDGLYNYSYHNYSRSNAYSDGYGAGTSQRGHEAPHRDGYAYAGGYAAYNGFGDVVGRNNADADDMLRSRGFAYFGKDTSDGSGHERTYWNARTKQCISVRTRSGSVYDAHSIKKKNCR